MQMCVFCRFGVWGVFNVIQKPFRLSPLVPLFTFDFFLAFPRSLAIVLY